MAPIAGQFGTLQRMIPWSLIYFRGIATPVLLGLGLTWEQREFVRWLIVAAFLSDWLDGVLARRWNVVSDELRRADCVADIAFYLSALVCAGIFCQTPLMPWLPYIGAIVVLECVCQLSNYVRFGCATATHAYLCKVWAVSLFVTAIELLADRRADWLMSGCLTLGYLAYVDVFVILALLPIPAVDVPSAFHAWNRRRDLFLSASFHRVGNAATPRAWIGRPSLFAQVPVGFNHKRFCKR